MKTRSGKVKSLPGIFAVLMLLMTMAPASSVMAQWTRVTQPANSSVTSIFSTGTTLLVNTASTTQANTFDLYRSTDNGLSWTKPLSGQDIKSFAMLGTDIFAGSRSQNSTSGGVFRSSDGGKTWTTVNNGLTSIDVWALTVNGTYLFAGTYNGTGGIFRSADKGQNWTKVGDMVAEGLVTLNGNIYVAGEGMGAFVSNDNGQSWQAFNKGLEQTDGFVMAVGVYGSSVFLATLNEGTFLLKGQTWTNVGDVGGIRTFAASGGNFYESGNYGGPYLSTNGGLTWMKFTGGLPDKSEVWELAVQGTDLYASASGKLYRLSKSGTVTAASTSNGDPKSSTAQNALPTPQLALKKVSQVIALKDQLNQKDQFIQIDLAVTNLADFNPSRFAANTTLPPSPCVPGSPYPIVATFYGLDRKKISCQHLNSLRAMQDMSLRIPKEKAAAGIYMVMTDRLTGAVVRSAPIAITSH